MKGLTRSFSTMQQAKDIPAPTRFDEFTARNLQQANSSVSIYFTRLKIVWEELSNYRPNCSCTNMGEYHAMEYVMSFLMGLDDSYSHVRGQILLMNPIPSINHVFSLIVQEEHQRHSTTNRVSNDGSITYAVHAGVYQIKILNTKTVSDPYMPSCRGVSG